MKLGMSDYRTENIQTVKQDLFLLERVGWKADGRLKRYEFEVILRKSSSLKNQKDQYSAQSVIGYGEMPKVREKDRAIFFRSMASELQCALESRLNARITGLDTRLCSGAYDG